MRRALWASLLTAFALTACNDDPVQVADAPDAPRALDGGYYAGTVTLTWELGPAWDGESFRVYGRRVDDADYFMIAEVTSCMDGFCSYGDANVEQDITYEYYVSAWDPSLGLETATATTVEVYVPQSTPPPVPNQTAVIALDNANYIVWGDAARVADFSFYRVYQASSDGNDYLLGETDSEGFVDLLAENGSTYEYFVTAVDVDGHESSGSGLAAGTPRLDYAGELLYDYGDVPDDSGFRFPTNETDDPGVPGDAPNAHFSVERDVDGLWWLLPGPDVGAEAFPTGTPTTALKCGVAADAACVDATVAPTSGYSVDAIPIDPEQTYFVRVRDDADDVHYGAIRVVMQGVDQNGYGVVIFDWAYQLQVGNPNLAPGAS